MATTTRTLLLLRSHLWSENASQPLGLLPSATEVARNLKKKTKKTEKMVQAMMYNHFPITISKQDSRSKVENMDYSLRATLNVMASRVTQRSCLTLNISWVHQQYRGQQRDFSVRCRARPQQVRTQQ